MVEDLPKPAVGSVPFIVRVAGLPASSMEPFASPICLEHLDAIRQLDAALEERRAGAVDRLYAACKDAPPDLRRYLLAIKRACFNNRPLKPYCQDARWCEVECILGPLAGELLAIEQDRLTRTADFGRDYLKERDRQVRAVIELAADPALARGVALASPVLARHSRATAAFEDRRGRKAILSLLRYASRAAFKTSPYSTLTRLGLGLTSIDHGRGGLRLVGGPWQERSQIRLRRHILDIYVYLLLRYPPFRDQALVTLNSTIVEIAPNKYRLLRPAHTEKGDQQEAIRYVPAALVTVQVSGELIAWLRRELPGRRTPFGALCTRLEDEIYGGADAEGSIRQTLDRLAEIGFLCLLPPWPTNEPQLERHLVTLLRTLPLDSSLTRLIDSLESVVEGEAGFACSSDPPRRVVELSGLVAAATQAAAALGEIDADMGRYQPDGLFYEDVFLVPERSTAGDWSEVARMPHRVARQILDDLEPLNWISSLHCNRFDALHFLAAQLANGWPGCKRVALIELFNAVQPTWRSFLEFQAAARRSEDYAYTTFNPLDLPAVQDLARLRTAVTEQLPSCGVKIEEGTRLSRRALRELIRRIPACYAPMVGNCLFLQPADAAGKMWVLNRIFEGTGRFSSRFTTVMGSAQRGQYTRFIRDRSHVSCNGELWPYVDLMVTQGNTVNLHASQTPLLMELPGENLDVPEREKVHIGDLFVAIDPLSPFPRLVERDGHPLFPVHLSTINNEYLPTILKFVALFGPFEYQPAIPPPRTWLEGQVTVHGRVQISNLILRRKRWSFAPSALPPGLDKMAEPEAFAAVNTWRMAHYIPQRVFLTEKLPSARAIYKPQFLDFGSPLFVSLLRSSAPPGDENMVLCEQLPLHKDLPVNETGDRWAVELQLDAISFGSHREASELAPSRRRTAHG